MQKNVPILYKKQPAIAIDNDGDKILIKFQVTPATATGKPAKYGQLKVREKDFVPLSEKTASSLDNMIECSVENIQVKIKEAWELLISDEETANSPILFSDLCDLIDSSLSADFSWTLFDNLCKSLEFALDENSFKNNQIEFSPRSQNQIEEINRKLFEKEHEQEIHDAFIARLKENKLLPEDAKYMVEVENVALGKTEKSKVMVELKIAQTPENAHKLLLDTGLWQITRNPYPTRYGLTTQSASEGLGKPPAEERVEVPGVAYAIDSPWSTDPDDAVAFDGTYLWVHIADPASFVEPESIVDKAAMNRGTTLYIPEGAVRMLCEDCLEDYALGLKKESNALSFRIKLDENACIEDCQIFRTKVLVERLTYEKADELKETPELKPLFEIARKNLARREKAGSVQIQMPEVHINVAPQTKAVSIAPLVRYESDSMICEMMLLAGEGAAHFAFKNNIPFPYVSQDAPDIPKDIPEGMAGQFKLLRCMHKRSVGITPGLHAGLGITGYSQVTSPLRRYSDLVAHQQLRAFIKGERLIDKDSMLMRISAGDAASIAAKKASRYSETHWKLVYLLQNPDWQGQAICLDLKGDDAIFMIPSLAMQFSLQNTENFQLNQEICVKAEKIHIPTQAVSFKKV